MIRAFIAVELPEALRQQVSAYQSGLKSSGANVKWVAADNLHLTLKFLGNIEETQLASLKESLAAAAAGSKPFTIRLEGIGAFPGTRSPRVLWLGITDGKERLIELAGTVEQCCSKLGFPPEDRPFSPHLTVGRVRSQERLAPLIKRLQVAEFQASEPAEVNQLVLFQSTLSPNGPLYTPLAEIPF